MEDSRGARWPKSGATRWPSHNYSSPGAYFVTICAHERQLLFARHDAREVIEWAWQEIPHHFAGVSLDAFVTMPSHVHGIVVISDVTSQTVGPQHAGALRKPASLSTIIRSFKAAVTRGLRMYDLHGPGPVWQSNYYDRVVRNDAELNRLREYIAQNPVAWQFDHENPNYRPNDVYERTWGWIEKSASSSTAPASSGRLPKP